MNMILIPSEFTHLKDRSNYNHNYYLNKRHNYTVLEVSDDDVEFSYYVVDTNREIYVGYHIGEEGLSGTDHINLG
jgi:hypothetical protein